MIRARVAVLVVAGCLAAQEPVAVEPESVDDLIGLDELDADELAALDELDVGGELGGGPEGGVDGLRLTVLRGFLSSRWRSFVRQRGRGLEDDRWISELQLELGVRWNEAVSAFYRPRFLIDALDQDLVRTDPLEMHVTWEGQRFDLRAGILLESWGIADTFQPLDVLNRRDLATDPLDLQRLGEFGARGRLWFEGGATLGEPMVSLYAMPVFQEAELPTPRGRFTFARAGTRLAEEQSETPRGADNALLAVRAQATLDTAWANADLQLIAVRGPQRFPAFEFRRSGTELVPVYFGATVLGGGFRAVPDFDWADEFTVKLEVAHTQPYRLDGRPTQLPDGYTQYAVGFDRLFPSVFAAQDQLTVTAEWVGEHGAHDAMARFRPFDEDLVLRLFWEANDFARSSVELRGLLDFGKQEYIVEALSQRQLRFVHEDLALQVGVQWFDVARDEPGFFALFPDNTNVHAELRLDF